MIIFGIAAYPLGAFLDYLLGTHHSTRFPRKDLKALIQLHELKKVRDQIDKAEHIGHGDGHGHPEVEKIYL